jgi:hypothetical protein
VALIVAVGSLVVSVTSAWIPGLAMRHDIDQVKQCGPAVVQAYRDDASNDAERVLAAPYSGSEAKVLSVRLARAEADIEGVLTEAPECVDTDQRARMKAELRLISMSLNELGKVAGGGSSARPSPSPS